MKNAINFPVYKAFDPQGKLFPDEVLPRWVGDAGVDHGATILIYDSYDGQNGSMLAWLLEYLGFTEVCMLNIF